MTYEMTDEKSPRVLRTALSHEDPCQSDPRRPVFHQNRVVYDLNACSHVTMLSDPADRTRGRWSGIKHAAKITTASGLSLALKLCPDLMAEPFMGEGTLADGGGDGEVKDAIPICVGIERKPVRPGKRQVGHGATL